ncbi:hypothetical protein ACSQ67_011508 [Phaseolus vulgaris]
MLIFFFSILTFSLFYDFAIRSQLPWRFFHAYFLAFSRLSLIAGIRTVFHSSLDRVISLCPRSCIRRRSPPEITGLAPSIMMVEVSNLSVREELEAFVRENSGLSESLGGLLVEWRGSGTRTGEVV